MKQRDEEGEEKMKEIKHIFLLTGILGLAGAICFKLGMYIPLPGGVSLQQIW